MHIDLPRSTPTPWLIRQLKNSNKTLRSIPTRGGIPIRRQNHMHQEELSLDDQFPSGKHMGEQVEDVLEDHPKYVVACVDFESYNFSEEVLQLMQARKLI